MADEQNQTKAQDQAEKVIPPAPEPEVDLASFWEGQYAEATAGGSQNFLFPKEEVTRVRLIGLSKDPRDWFRRVENEYQGKVSLKYMVLGFRVYRSGEEGEPMLQAVVFTKGAWGHISQMAREGYDFFSPKGVGLVINRLNTGGRISYNVIPAPIAVPVPPDILKAAKEASWDFYLEEYQKMQDGRGNDQGNAQGGGSSVADQIVNAPQSTASW